MLRASIKLQNIDLLSMSGMMDSLCTAPVDI